MEEVYGDVGEDMTDDRKRLRYTTAVEYWESHTFAKLYDSFGVDVNDDTVTAVETLPEKALRFPEKLDQHLRNWAPQPPDSWKNAIVVIALYVDSNINWDSQSDILVSRVLGTLYIGKIVAHPDGVHRYENGGFKMIEELPPEILIEIEETLM